MGQYLTPEEVRKRFAGPLLGLASDFGSLCDRWEEAHDSQRISRRELLLNDVTPELALGTLRKLLREASGKLEDAIAGVYRYRDLEKRQKTGKKKGPRDKHE